MPEQVQSMWNFKGGINWGWENLTKMTLILDFVTHFPASLSWLGHYRIIKIIKVIKEKL